jgi:hypothetical protein
MNEKSTCIFCGGEAIVEDISGEDAYRIKCSCGTYGFSEDSEEGYKGMDDEDKQAVSDYIKDCNEKDDIPELHKLFGTDELNWHIANYKKKIK